jgi:hypothetical protein
MRGASISKPLATWEELFPRSPFLILHIAPPFPARPKQGDMLTRVIDLRRLLASKTRLNAALQRQYSRFEAVGADISRLIAQIPFLRATGFAEQSNGSASVPPNRSVSSRRSVASGKVGFRRPSGP